MAVAMRAGRTTLDTDEYSMYHCFDKIYNEKTCTCYQLCVWISMVFICMVMIFIIYMMVIVRMTMLMMFGVLKRLLITNREILLH